MQQDFLETAIKAHVLVLGQIMEQGGETLLQSHRDIHPFNLERWSGARQAMSKVEIVAGQIADRVFAHSPGLVIRWRYDFDSIAEMKPVELVGVANHEIHRTPFRTGRAQ